MAAERYVDVGAAPASILLAVSGGADSLTLLDASVALGPSLGLRLEVATVDHGLRATSKEEVERVRALAKALGVPFHGLQVEVAPGAGLEARARELRYAALEQARRKAGLDFVATAHTATDQAETVLMRLGRGSGLSGAAGVRARRGRVIRPLLQVTRKQVEAYVRARDLRPVVDPMNADPSYTRVRIRQQVLPALVNALGPAAELALARFATFAAQDEALLAEWASEAAERLALDDGSVDAVGLRALPGPLRRRVLAGLLVEAGVSVDAAALERMERALGRRGSASVGGRATLRTAGERVRVEGPRGLTTGGALSQREREVALHLDGPAVQIGHFSVSWTSTPTDGAQPVLSEVGADALQVRFRKPGDRVQLPTGHTKKLQDLLVDARVPAEQRGEVPLVVDGQMRIVCVVGVWPRRGRSVAGWIRADRLISERASGEGKRYKGAQRMNRR